MRKLTALFLVVALVAATFGCATMGPPPDDRDPTIMPTPEETKETFVVTLAASIVASFMLALDQSVPGALLSEGTQTLTLNRVNVNRLLDGQVPTTVETISGRVTSPGDNLVADLSVTGGTIVTIEYTVTGEQLESNKPFSVVVVANGHEITVELTQDDLIE